MGFSVKGGSLKLGIFTARESMASTATVYTPLVDHRKFTALDGALGKAQLQGVDAVKLIGTSLVLQINRSSVASGGVLDWRQSSLSAAALSLSPSDPTFRIGGSVGLSIADLVYGSATISVSRSLVTGVTVTETSGVSTLKGDLFAIAIYQAKLFIGSGASLDTNSSSTGFGSVTLPASNDAQAVGFSVSAGTLDLGVFTARESLGSGGDYAGLTTVRKYTGLQASLGKAQLQGVDAVKLIGTSLVLQLNRTSVTNGSVLDWTQTPVSSAAVRLKPSDPTFRIGGSVGLSIADVVYGSAVVDVARTQVSAVTVTESTGAVTYQGDLLSIAVTQATLFIGSGATLNQDATSAAFGAVSLPASNDPKAVGFSVSGGTLNLGIFTATGRLTAGTYAPLSTTLKYTGLQGALGKAQL
ncbi:MAG: hypothetical protein EBU81_07770, partial [Proteobacteria bacterium]|nr:hypothetical protein [Pseudomonadota bacterium]